MNLIKYFKKKPEYIYLTNKLIQKKSYAQRNEDIAIEALIGKVKSFIDIGANDGYSGSNTFKFALNGAKGLCFEPVNSIYSWLKRLYRLNGNIICINAGISDIESQVEIRVDGVISTILQTEDPVNKECLSAYINQNAEIDTIQVYPLQKYINQHPDFNTLDLLSIDVEGHELNVLKGIEFTNMKIKCIVLETLGGKTSNYKEIEGILRQNNFVPVLTNNLNTIYLHKSFAQGNKISQVCLELPEYEYVVEKD